jgi:hypothetical protein
VEVKPPKTPAFRKANKEAPTSSLLPRAEQIDHREYLARTKVAGYMTDPAEVRHFNQDAHRSDMIAAINAFIGYDVSKDFGSQEFQARSLAARQARQERGEHLPAVSKTEKQEAARLQASIQGYVSGVPDTVSTHRNNLEARERLAVAAIIQHEREAEAAPLFSEARAKATALAQLERERLVEIRKDLY